MIEIAIVGNGSTAVDEAGYHYVNSHTAEFLSEVNSESLRCRFVQPQTMFRAESNLQNKPFPHGSELSVLLPASRGLGRFAYLLKLMGILRNCDFAYIFFPGSVPVIAALMCMLLGKKYGIYLRGDPERTRGRWLAAPILRRARFVATVSASIASRYLKYDGRVTRIRPMVDIQSKDALRRDFEGRPDGRWKLLFVGRVEKAKGICELMAAARTMHENGFPFHLEIVGGGPLLDSVREALRAAPDLPVRAAGPIADKAALRKLYEESDLFILPTHHEGFPRVLYEAMIKSLVVVTTPVGGIPELMVDGENCVLVPVGDAGALARAVQAVCADWSRMQALSSSGLATTCHVLSTFPRHASAFKEAFNV